MICIQGRSLRRNLRSSKGWRRARVLVAWPSLANPAQPLQPHRIARATEGAFTSRRVRRGSELYRSSHAALEGIGEHLALINVHDQGVDYRVTLDTSELEVRERLRVECQCKSFTAGYPCEHVFAGIIALDESGQGHRLISPELPFQRIDVVPQRVGIRKQVDRFFLESASSLPQEPDLEQWPARLQNLQIASLSDNFPKPPIGSIDLSLDPIKSENAGAPVISTWSWERGAKVKSPLFVGLGDLERLDAPDLKTALEILTSCPSVGDDQEVHQPAFTRRVPAGLQSLLFRELSGRLRLGDSGPKLRLDEGPPWEFRLELSEHEEHLRASGVVQRENQAINLADLELVLRDGWFIGGSTIYRLSNPDFFDWIRNLRKEGPVYFRLEDRGAYLEKLGQLSKSPELSIVSGFSDWQFESPPPIPSLDFGATDLRTRRVGANLKFAYDTYTVDYRAPGSAVIDAEKKRFVRRDRLQEDRWVRRLQGSGMEFDQNVGFEIRSSFVSEVEEELVGAGAEVSREGKRLQQGRGSKLRLLSDGDFFTLEGEVLFGDTSVPLQNVISMLRKKEDRLSLPDGSEGILSSKEAQRFRALVGLSISTKGGVLGYRSSQAILLDTLLYESDSVVRDEGFKAQVEKLRGQLEVVSQETPAGFAGELRPYQSYGLGWMQALRNLSLGGCLADDMGLGKTIQVLSLLTHVKACNPNKPSLVVAPRSLVFNWRQEATRFTPDLNLIEYTGQQRSELLKEIQSCDVVLTTYGTLRKDADILRSIDFDYVVLDEAQMIKNHNSQVSKAARSLRCHHRLALSGTPVENDVSELWSLFEFLNPSMLGSKTDFVRLTQGQSLHLVGQGLSPLLLRRKKEDVLKELPEKTELTIYCDLSLDERKRYDALRTKYLSRIEAKVAETSQFSSARTEVLEALLRLRQTACHPGLVDAKKSAGSSTKLETLLHHVREVTAENHKVLIFSQFVQLLEIVRTKLDAETIPYAYLDGSTRNRELVVSEFQSNPDIQVFLISLRAGGLGLNLTAADYVFILDPWWNPAVEAQAIDRAHRIGQTKKVFAYRYIARDTVEERILALHRDKRAMAEALIDGQNPQSNKLSLDDLRRLLQ